MPDKKIKNEIFNIILIMCIPVIGVILILSNNTVDKTLALSWSLASFLMGGFIGFLFGVPKVYQNADIQNLDSKEVSLLKHLPNTNLEQISDWLTKIIVGLGLVELRNTPELMNNFAAFIALGLGSNKNYDEPFAYAIIVTYSIFGFIAIYSYTRIHLSKELVNSDKENFGKNNERLSETIADILINKAKEEKTMVESTGNSASAENSNNQIKKSYYNIIWFNRSQSVNESVILALKKENKFVTILSSIDKLIKSTVLIENDLLILFIENKIELQFNEEEEINLIKNVKQKSDTIQIIVYSVSPLNEEYKSKLEMSGADFLTDSSVELLRKII